MPINGRFASQQFLARQFFTRDEIHRHPRQVGVPANQIVQLFEIFFRERMAMQVVQFRDLFLRKIG
jgi:hypothetical protein